MARKTPHKLSMKPKQVARRLLSVLPPRARDVIVNRYGLGATPDKHTLESIGSMYGITRERVRQIESYALAAIRKSEPYKEEQGSFDELEHIINDLGGVIPEQELLDHVSPDPSVQNHIHFLLVVGEKFVREKESNEFIARWHVNPEVSGKIEAALRHLYGNLSTEELIPESQLINRFLEEVKDLNEKYKREEVIKRWLGISKQLGRNPLGEWGVATSSNVRAKGMRDYAYLAIKRHGSPMHFTEVAQAISQLFHKRAHVATTHNELIKDPRFVLVGRGLYALAEWGYSTGVVKDVIRDILKKFGPLTREEIIEKVRKERYVKDNTILVNLQDSRYFRKDKDGTYALAAS